MINRFNIESHLAESIRLKEKTKEFRKLKHFNTTNIGDELIFYTNIQNKTINENVDLIKVKVKGVRTIEPQLALELDIDVDTKHFIRTNYLNKQNVITMLDIEFVEELSSNFLFICPCCADEVRVSTNNQYYFSDVLQTDMCISCYLGENNEL